jgi:ketosteroid isomerase-like protein
MDATIRRTVALTMAAFIATLDYGCATRRAEAGKQCDPSAAALSAATEYLVARDNARDLEGVLAGYTEDIIWLPPSGEPVTGKDAIRPRYEGLFATNRIDLSSHTAEAFAQDGLGFVRGTTTGMVTPLSGQDAIRVDDKFMAIVRCQSGTWRVSRLMWSPVAGSGNR